MFIKHWNKLVFRKQIWELGVLVHAFNPSTQSTKWVPGRPGLYRETLSRKTKKKEKKKKKRKQIWGFAHMCSTLKRLIYKRTSRQDPSDIASTHRVLSNILQYLKKILLDNSKTLLSNVNFVRLMYIFPNVTNLEDNIHFNI